MSATHGNRQILMLLVCVGIFPLAVVPCSVRAEEPRVAGLQNLPVLAGPDFSPWLGKPRSGEKESPAAAAEKQAAARREASFAVLQQPWDTSGRPGVPAAAVNASRFDQEKITASLLVLSEASEPSPDDMGFISYQPPVMPIQPPVQPQAPPQPLTTSLLAGGDTVSSGLSLPSLSTTINTGASATSVGTTKDIVSATQQTDLAGAMQQSNTGQTVQTQQRSPVSMDPNIRGYKQGQVYALSNGAYWSPARQDLDTMLSKIDPWSIEEVFVVNGPYGLRYGPGFAFIDVKQAPTPRHQEGLCAQATTLVGVRTNGQQFYAREVVEGGGSNYGFRFSYGDRQGGNYSSGADFKIPSGYHNRDETADLGFDLTEYRRVEVSFQRLDQTNTDYPGEFFDIGWLGSYGLDVRLTDANPMAPWTKLSVGAWYNRTDFLGNTNNKRDPNFPMISRVEAALTQELGYNTHLDATSDGNANSGGARIAGIFGDLDDRHFNLGVDARMLGQRIDEYFAISNANTYVVTDRFTTNMPRAWLNDVGTYAEWIEPVMDEWSVTVGARVDAVNADARASDLRNASDSSLPHSDELKQNDVLYSCYLQNRYDLDEHWKLTGSVGYAQRPATLTERYADGLFLGVLQTGFTRVIGDPTIESEKNCQIDAGLSAEYDRWRGKLTGYHAWIADYITYEDAFVPGVSSPIVPRLLQFRNTDLATLAGFEVLNEYDMSDMLTAFMTMGYVDGRDRELDAPLPAISPLASTAGLRLHDAAKGSRWGVEMNTRMVARQDRLGAIYNSTGTGAITAEEPTPGFMIWNLRGYYNYSKTFHLMAGVENLFDKNYLEHLDLRVGGPNTGAAQYGVSRVYRPGVTPYFGLEWQF
jgi:outer membrane receptor protein involved in Fe transport